MMNLETSTDFGCKAPLYFERAYDSFKEAQKSYGDGVTYYLRIAHRTIRLEFAGTALVPLFLPAFRHLVVKENLESPPPPDLTVCIWDNESTGVSFSRPPCTDFDFGPLCEIKGYNNERFHTVAQYDYPVMQIFDAQKKLAFFWTERKELLLHPWERSCLLRNILHWSTSDSPSRQLIHAGAVGTKKGAVLITGKKGTGKSTSTLACIDSSLFYLGDDFVIVDSEPAPRVHSIYCTGRLHFKDLSRFPHLARANGVFQETEKAMFYFQDLFPAKLVPDLPLRAILLSTVTGKRDTQITEAKGGASLLALAPSTLRQLPGTGNREFQKLVGLVNRVPCHYLEAGTDLTQIPKAILNFLEGP